MKIYTYNLLMPIKMHTNDLTFALITPTMWWFPKFIHIPQHGKTHSKSEMYHSLNSIYCCRSLLVCHLSNSHDLQHINFTWNCKLMLHWIFCDVAIPSLRKTWEDLFHVSSHQKGHVTGKVIIQNSILIINILLCEG